MPEHQNQPENRSPDAGDSPNNFPETQSETSHASVVSPGPASTHPFVDATPTGDPLLDAIKKALSQVEDPELHVDILTLELIYDVKIHDGHVDITMTLTSIACPYGPMLVEMVRQSVSKVEGVKQVNVQVSFEPPWQPSEDLKAMMGLL
ncbi:MAG: metal-sulfur cluster assembly factor [Candidatus Diapherotrites archaeon]|nr:metal-sulfur cluster assembly factor [Candidatus Diapherotrites archaeon]MDZ4256570.1 metal-sulfur cluster assembly factor [archaeon]